MTDQQSPYALVQSREGDYDKSWLITNELIQKLQLHTRKIGQSEFQFAWTMILNKLVRAMASPEKADHWTDIQGYAQLILNRLESMEEPVKVGDIEVPEEPASFINKRGAS